MVLSNMQNASDIIRPLFSSGRYNTSHKPSHTGSLFIVLKTRLAEIVQVNVIGLGVFIQMKSVPLFMATF